ncbi:MAG: hypothetical protein HC888_17875 [Candidatus Competibacteraceae bacterium]|nr:hypothetical protein [Candidatus Competibacteraceae bacterium]
MAWKLSRSRSVSGIFVAPGNAGTAAIAQNIADVDGTDNAAVVDRCRKLGIDLVLIRPGRPPCARHRR